MDSPASGQMQNCYSDCEDTELVQCSQHGDQDAFAELVHRYRIPAMKVAVSILQDRHEAEDEVQNALWKAYEHIGQFQSEARFSTWLTRIVVNQCLMRLRQLRRAKLLYIEEAVSADEGLTLELRDTRQSPERELGASQIARVLEEEIRRTPPMLRSVFLLRDVERRSMSEVADELGVSVSAAKSRLLRARAELRNRLGRHCASTGPASLLAR